MKWFKFYGEEYISDPKMFSLTPAERSCWITLLSYASQTEDGIIKHLTEDILMTQAGLTPLLGPDYQQEEWDNTKGILDKFKKLEMIQIDNDVIKIINWKKRQETNLTGYERVKKYRRKKRLDNAMITIDKNRIDKNRKEENINSSKKERRFYKPTGEEMRFSANKWWVLPKDGGEWSEFAGNLTKDTEIK